MRKFYAVALAICLIFSMSLPAFAAEMDSKYVTSAYVTNGTQLYRLDEALSTIDIAREISDAKNGLIGENVDPDILKSIELSSAASENVSYSVKKLGDVLTRNGETGSLYSLTAVSTTKTTSDTTDMDNVHAYLSVTWIDHLGVNNELVAVQGGWQTARTLYDRTVYYGVDSNNVTKYPSGNSFSYANLGIRGYQIHAVSTVRSAGYDPVITVMIATDILD